MCWRGVIGCASVSGMRFLVRIPWLLLLLLLVAVAWSIRPISDMDVLWHLRTGQWMLAHGDVIRHDIFSATRHGCEWVSVPWLYQVMLAKLHAAFGWSGLTLWQVSMVAAITLQTALLVWLLRRSDRAPGQRESSRWDWKWPFLSVPAALAVLLLLRLLQLRINCRPELNTYLFLGTFLIILTLVTRNSGFRIQDSDGTLHPAPSTHLLIWLLPLLQVLWTNTHGAFILGPALVWAYAAAAWLGWFATRWEVARERPVDPDGLAPLTEGEWPRQPIDPAPARLTVAAALTTLACLATPYSFAGAFYPFHLFYVLTDPLYKNGIGEGRPVNLFTTFDSGGLGYAFLACWVFAGLGLLGRLMEGMRDGESEPSSVSSEQLAVTSEQAFASGLQRMNPRRCTVHRLLLTAYCSLLTSCRALWHVLAHDPDLGYLVSCAAMAYLSLTAIRNVPLLPLAVAPLVASGM